LKKLLWIVLCVIFLALLVVRNTTYYRTPDLITADGDELVACTGILSVTSEGSPLTYSIAYTDQAGAHVRLYGIHKLQIVDTRDIGAPASCEPKTPLR
jgi:hypothetical protein